MIEPRYYQISSNEKNEFTPPEILFTMHGEYTSPIKTEIAGIDTYVVDPHNEVFPFWAFAKNKIKKPLVLLHIDAHADLCGGSRTLESLAEENQNPGIFEYSKKHLNIASFISAAFFYKVISSMYWIIPREKYAYALGMIDPIDKEIIGKPVVREEFGKIRFGISEPTPLLYKVDYKETILALNNYKNSIILDIDLDAFECIEDKNYCLRRKYLSANLSSLAGKPIRNRRIKKTSKILSKLPKPQIMTIARSQTPIASTPAETVDEIELTLLNMLESVYL